MRPATGRLPGGFWVRDYLDFEIDMTRAGNRLAVDVSSPFGETPQPAEVPFDDRTAERIRYGASQLAQKNLDSRSLLQLGWSSDPS